MRVFLQTRLNKPTMIYDTDSPSTGSSKSGVGKIIMALVKPYAKIQEGNITLYELNKPYHDESMKWKLLFGIAAGAIVLGGASLIFGLGRMSK